MSRVLAKVKKAKKKKQKEKSISVTEIFLRAVLHWQKATYYRCLKFRPALVTQASGAVWNSQGSGRFLCLASHRNDRGLSEEVFN